MANKLCEITGWPWLVEWSEDGPEDPQGTLIGGGKSELPIGGIWGKYSHWQSEAATRANGSLIELAPDHALLLAAFVAGKLECLFSSNENGTTIGGCSVGPSRGGEGGPAPQVFRFEMDPFGCPIVNDELRAAIKAALGLEKGGGQ